MTIIYNYIFNRMATYSPNHITGKCYILRNYSNGIFLNMSSTYCIDHNPVTWNIVGVWENKEECLKMYGGDPAHNRIGGTIGLDTSASCWDVLSEIHKSEYEQRDKHWFFRKCVLK